MHVSHFTDVVVIGAGVAGLTAAWRLRAAGVRTEVLEARDRVGGRAWTRTVDGRGLDLGATWVWDTETHVHGLLAELGLTASVVARDGLDLYDDGTIHRGRLPVSAVPERRIDGGMGALVDALAARAGPIQLCRPVTRLARADGRIVVHTGDTAIEARAVLAALPPSLVAPWSAELPASLRHVPVWMGEVAKCVGCFDRPVWAEQGLSGRAISRLGPMSEVHDLSDDAGPALFGFAHRGDATDLEARVSAQFERLFGVAPAALVLQRWWAEPRTTTSEVEDQRLFGHPMLREPLLGDRLHLVSCETSGVSPGHLDGAVERAETVCRTLLP